jgi:hypothetical protein
MTTATQPDRLLSQIDARSREIQTDAYPMSIGELMSLYRDGELDIHPEFQRFFRWSNVQKSKFIESILLGIPIPSIFVSQRDDGVWDVVDGVQRLSTVFEFVGILRDVNGTMLPPSSLVGTEYLPDLKGMCWEGRETEKSLPESLRIDFKRQRLDIKIIKRQSDEAAKYDLFERLNTLGSHLSPQEVRNCLMVMLDRGFFTWLGELAAHETFLNAIALTDRALEERYEMELTLRYLIFIQSSEDDLRAIDDVNAFVTTKMRQLVAAKDFDRAAHEHSFRTTFDVLYGALGENAFGRPGGGRGRGGFLVSMFEVVGIGLGHALLHGVTAPDGQEIAKRVEALARDSTFTLYARSGVRASSRLPHLIPLGRRLFLDT